MRPVVPNGPQGVLGSVLIVSNGHGEDAVGAVLAGRLGASGLSVTAYPLVGLGDAYGAVPRLAPRRTLPSGGFGLRGSWSELAADLRSGLLSHWWAQLRALRGERGRHNLAVAIGDTYCLAMAARVAHRYVLIETAKSEYNERHRWLERRVMRRAETVWTRDEPTARRLAGHGIAARWVGNPLMDAIADSAALLPLSPGAPLVLLLPGSRADAAGNLASLLNVARRVHAVETAQFVVALAPALRIADVFRVSADHGWEAEDTVLRRGDLSVWLIREFGAALRVAVLAVGLTGTANEQAAGSGIPVVAFPGPGAQYTRRFMLLQQRLLGEALVAASGWEAAAAAVVRLLRDAEERTRRGAVGRQRMGAPGAVDRIAGAILAMLDVQA